MGINPNEETYTEADEPGVCNLLLFGGRTPRYIEAHITGVVLCPVATAPSPNGTFILTQASSIRWEYSDTDRFLQLRLRADLTAFSILGRPGFQNLFTGESGICVDTIPNGQVDCTLPNYGHSGSVVCYWGPGISP